MRKSKIEKEPLVIIVIVSWNKKNLIGDCLKTLKKNTSYKNYKVIVSDNGSTDGGVEMIKKDFKWVELIENNKNLGFGLANNIAIDYAFNKFKPDYILLLNNDTKIIDNNWLNYLVETGESSKKIGLVESKLVFEDNTPQFFVINKKTHYINKDEIDNFSKSDLEKSNKKQFVEFAQAGCLLIKESVINKIGLFEKFIPYYGEEIDYSKRVLKNGFQIVYDPRSVVVHLKAQTINAKVNLNDWYIMKKHSIKVEILNYSLKDIFYWGSVHIISIFFRKRGGKIKFNFNFFKRGILLIKAYWENLIILKELLHKRKHREEKIWFMG